MQAVHTPACANVTTLPTQLAVRCTHFFESISNAMGPTRCSATEVAAQVRHTLPVFCSSRLSRLGFPGKLAAPSLYAPLRCAAYSGLCAMHRLPAPAESAGARAPRASPAAASPCCGGGRAGRSRRQPGIAAPYYSTGCASWAGALSSAFLMPLCLCLGKPRARAAPGACRGQVPLGAGFGLLLSHRCCCRRGAEAFPVVFCSRRGSRLQCRA